jgi:hypothetical protein
VGDGWLSGYNDTIAERLAEEGVGVLAPVDAAVLTLVLLHVVAIPAARGDTDAADWSSGDLAPASLEDLTNNRDRRLTNKAARASLGRLKDAGILRPGRRSNLVPGPQFRRLTDKRSRMIWENLIIAAAPASSLARSIERRRGPVDG